MNPAKSKTFAGMAPVGNMARQISFDKWLKGNDNTVTVKHRLTEFLSHVDNVNFQMMNESPAAPTNVTTKRLR